MTALARYSQRLNSCEYMFAKVCNHAPGTPPFVWSRHMARWAGQIGGHVAAEADIGQARG